MTREIDKVMPYTPDVVTPEPPSVDEWALFRERMHDRERMQAVANDCTASTPVEDANARVALDPAWRILGDENP